MGRISVLLYFVLGACTAVAAQSVAAPDAATEGPAPASSMAAAQTVAVRGRAEADVRVAQNGKARVAVLAVGKNAFIGELTMEAGAAVPEHADATEEYIVVLEGSGVITIEGQPHPVEAGSTIYMEAGATVSFLNGDAPMRAIQVFAGPEPATKYDAWTPG